MKYLNRRKIVHFVCEKVDRLLRNFKDTVMVEDWLAADETRRLHLPKNSLVLHKSSSSQDKFVWGMHVVVAKNYTDNLSEEVRKGQLEKLRRGWLPGVPPPGYENVGLDGKKVQRIVPATAGLVVRLFKLAATGQHTLTSLTEEMAQAGLLNEQGKPLSRSMVHRILRNPYYVGLIRWKGLSYAGSHEPLISNDLFERAVRATTRPRKDGHRFRKHRPLFQGLVICATCRRRLIWETQKGHWYGKCPKVRSCGRSRFVREETMEALVVSHFQALKSPSPRLVSWLREGLESVMESEFAGIQAALRQLSDRETQLETQRATLYDDRLEGRIGVELYDARAAKLNVERAEIRRRRAQLESNDTSYLEAGLNFLTLAQNVALEYQGSRDISHKRKLIGEFFDELLLDGERLEGTYNERARWALREVVSLKVPSNGKIEPPDYGSAKEKRACSETLNPTWLRLRDTIRTTFMADCQ